MKLLIKSGLMLVLNLYAPQGIARIAERPASIAVTAAGTAGSGSVFDPIRIGAVTGPLHYSHTVDTRDCVNQLGAKANECCYQFSVEQPMLVIANHAGSEVVNSMIDLYANDGCPSHIEGYVSTQALTPTRELWRHYEAQLAEELRTLSQNELYGQAFMCRIVAPGDYLIVSEGISGNIANNGVIKTNIHILDMPGKGFEAPYLWECGGDEFDVSANFCLADYGVPSDAPMSIVGKIDLEHDTALTVFQDWLYPGGVGESTVVGLSLRTESGEILSESAIVGDHQCFLSDSLPCGNYYVCSEFPLAEGYCYLNVRGSRIHSYGIDLEHPIDLGMLYPGDSRLDIKDSRDYPNVASVFRNRIFYRFAIPQDADVTISTQGSPLTNTAIELTDRNGDRQDWDRLVQIDSCGAATVRYGALPGGTYYFIVEGRYENGVIHSSIRVNELDDPIPEPEIFKPSERKNYILTVSPRRAMADARNQAVSNARYAVSYYDGLGRPQQTVLRGAAPDKRDIVAATEYDRHGLVHRQWLPAVHTSTGGFVAWKDAATDFYADTRPYAEATYELSPLHRPLAQTGPGKRWYDANRNVSAEYLLNTADGPLQCRYFDVADGLLIELGNYPPGTLSVQRTTDEDRHDRYTFTDGFGRVVLERRICAEKTADTYYVYDVQGDLCYVLPPVLCEQSNIRAGLDRYAFRYAYDSQHRMTEKKLPGIDPVCYVYDASDRVIFTQDGAQRERGEWTLTLCDLFGRPAVTGIYCGQPPCAEISSLHVYARPDAAHPTGYSLNTSLFSLDSVQFHRIDYYDDYSFVARTPYDATLRYVSDPRFGQLGGRPGCAFSTNTLATGCALYDTQGESVRYRAVYYDYRHRPIQVRTVGDEGFLSVEHTGYAFAGEATLKSETVRPASGLATDSLVTSNRYDHYGRLRSSHTILNASDTVCVRYEYDVIGRLSATIQGRASDTLRTDMRYNLRGWETSRKSDHFSMQLSYESPEHAAPSYTGNITEWRWRHGADAAAQTYVFSYDALSRLTSTSLLEDNVQTDRFVERGLSYDGNGNLLTLQRTENGAVANDFSYTYDGNRLISLTDGGTSYAYTYDSNGNMTRDGAHDLDLRYNKLNLIEKVTRDGATMANYSYLSDGTKISATNASGDGLVYIGSLVYRKRNGVLSLESAGFNGGRFVATNTGIEPRYFLTDHLGSTRVVVNSAGKVLERNDYHAYGKRWTDANSLLSDNRYGYNGKEKQDFVNLPYIDYGARQYDPLRGEWNAADPLASVFSSYTPYGFCLNNPLKFKDETGRNPVIVVGGIVLTLSDLLLISTGMITTGVILQQSADTGQWGLSPTLKQYDPGWKHQQSEDRKRKEALDRAQANVQESINDNFPDPDDYDPNKMPQFKRGKKWQKIILLVLARIGGSGQIDWQSFHYYYDLLLDYLCDKDEDMDNSESQSNYKDYTDQSDRNEDNELDFKIQESYRQTNRRIRYEDYIKQYLPNSNY